MCVCVEGMGVPIPPIRQQKKENQHRTTVKWAKQKQQTKWNGKYLILEINLWTLLLINLEKRKLKQSLTSVNARKLSCMPVCSL